MPSLGQTVELIRGVVVTRVRGRELSARSFVSAFTVQLRRNQFMLKQLLPKKHAHRAKVGLSTRGTTERGQVLV